jgi:hypothetical protein
MLSLTNGFSSRLALLPSILEPRSHGKQTTFSFGPILIFVPSVLAVPRYKGNLFSATSREPWGRGIAGEEVAIPEDACLLL